jgi:hypothetical protein
MGASYVRTQDSRKNKRFMLTVKKTKKIFFLFYTGHKNVPFYPKTCVWTCNVQIYM